MIWIYYFGYDNRGWLSLERSVKFINEIGSYLFVLYVIYVY